MSMFKMEGFYREMVELQEKLRRSEEERFRLEEKFNEMMRLTRDAEQERLRSLRHKYNKFIDEDRRRQERNGDILRRLERIENRATSLSAKTERFNQLRKQYASYLRSEYEKPSQKISSRPGTSMATNEFHQEPNPEFIPSPRMDYGTQQRSYVPSFRRKLFYDKPVEESYDSKVAKSKINMLEQYIRENNDTERFLNNLHPNQNGFETPEQRHYDTFLDKIINGTKAMQSDEEPKINYDLHIREPRTVDKDTKSSPAHDELGSLLEKGLQRFQDYQLEKTLYEKKNKTEQQPQVETREWKETVHTPDKFHSTEEKTLQNDIKVNDLKLPLVQLPRDVEIVEGKTHNIYPKEEERRYGHQDITSMETTPEDVRFKRSTLEDRVKKEQMLENMESNEVKGQEVAPMLEKPEESPVQYPKDPSQAPHIQRISPQIQIQKQKIPETYETKEKYLPVQIENQNTNIEKIEENLPQKYQYEPQGQEINDLFYQQKPEYQENYKIREAGVEQTQKDNVPNYAKENNQVYEPPQEQEYSDQSYHQNAEQNAPQYSDQNYEQSSHLEQNMAQYTEENPQQYMEPTSPQYTQQNVPQHSEENAPQYVEQLPQYTEQNAPKYSDNDAQQYVEQIPQYSEQNAPPHSEENAPQYSEENAPQYSEENAPQYSEQNAPQYSEEKAPQYSEENAPEYVEQIPQYAEQNNPQYDPNTQYDEQNVPQYKQQHVEQIIDQSTYPQENVEQTYEEKPYNQKPQDMKYKAEENIQEYSAEEEIQSEIQPKAEEYAQDTQQYPQEQNPEQKYDQQYPQEQTYNENAQPYPQEQIAGEDYVQETPQYDQNYPQEQPYDQQYTDQANYDPNYQQEYQQDPQYQYDPNYAPEQYQGEYNQETNQEYQYEEQYSEQQYEQPEYQQEIPQTLPEQYSENIPPEQQMYSEDPTTNQIPVTDQVPVTEPVPENIPESGEKTALKEKDESSSLQSESVGNIDGIFVSSPEKNVEPQKSPNLMKMLESDTESSMKQDTKVSNDSDFDFSQN